MSATEVSEHSGTGAGQVAREQALDEFLAAADEAFGPVPAEVLDELRACWPE
jgi:hypothetical protein